MSKTIVFFGSGPVAAECLSKLITWQPIELVVTKRRPAHHKDPAPVEQLAIKENLKLEFADNKLELDELIHKSEPNSLLAVVIDYGVIISQQTIDYFPLGILNSHFSLLPHWRGADPITYSILSGQKETGVSIMQITAGLDEGPLLMTGKIEVGERNSIELTSELINVSDGLLKILLEPYMDTNKQVTPFQQDLSQIVTFSRKLTKQDGLINTAKTATEICREIRAFIEWPKSKITLNNKVDIVVTKASPVSKNLKINEVLIENNEIFLGCRVDALKIEKLKPAGKKEMDARSFLNGYQDIIEFSTK